MKIGIFGGTFDPPHLGHRIAAEQIKEILALDRVIMVPAKLPPHKSLSHLSAEAEDRLAMTKLMADGLGAESFLVSDVEIHREGKSYSVDTIEALRREYPEDELWVCMGSDMFLTFHEWNQPERIGQMAGICGFTRVPQESGDAMRKQAAKLEAKFGMKTTVLELHEDIDVSSSDVRQLLSTKKHQQIDRLLWSQVYGYILRKGLYGLRVNLKKLTDYQLRAVSYSMMRAKRIPHVQGTEQEAVKLAKRWGENVRNARRGAILHDCTKYYSMEEHLAICKNYGIELDALEQKAEKLLHSKSGAALAEHWFGEPKEVVDAIFYHTTAKEDMTTLEKILYIADYMEPHRDFDGVEKLRELAYADLDAAVALGCQMSIDEMKERGREVHPNTAAALKFLRQGKE